MDTKVSSPAACAVAYREFSLRDTILVTNEASHFDLQRRGGASSGATHRSIQRVRIAHAFETDTTSHRSTRSGERGGRGIRWLGGATQRFNVLRGLGPHAGF